MYFAASANVKANVGGPHPVLLRHISNTWLADCLQEIYEGNILLSVITPSASFGSAEGNFFHEESKVDQTSCGWKMDEQFSKYPNL